MVVVVTSTSRLVVGEGDPNNNNNNIIIYVNDPEVEVIHNSTEMNEKAELIGFGPGKNKGNTRMRTW